MIVIVDYGMGNLGSVLKSFKKLKIEAMISTSIQDIENADKLILPGVGHFFLAMKRLEEYKYIDVLNKKVLIDKTPILGICLGMQLFSQFSYEGNIKGLNWIDAEVVRFKVDDKLKWKVPHMGWNSILLERENIFLEGIPQDELFYFVHSYHMVCKNKNDILASTNYSYKFASVVQKDNIFGTQFHPEKSHDRGQDILKNFASKI
jgi:imidazole glycerol-phosphate synthase subunit HisH